MAHIFYALEAKKKSFFLVNLRGPWFEMIEMRRVVVLRKYILYCTARN